MDETDYKTKSHYLYIIVYFYTKLLNYGCPAKASVKDKGNIDIPREAKERAAKQHVAPVIYAKLYAGAQGSC